MEKALYAIDLRRDESDTVWIATSEDVTGLALESVSLDELKKQVGFAVPDLLKINKIQTEGRFSLVFHFCVESEVA
jgi:hypothetical protein